MVGRKKKIKNFFYKFLDVLKYKRDQGWSIVKSIFKKQKAETNNMKKTIDE